MKKLISLIMIVLICSIVGCNSYTGDNLSNNKNCNKYGCVGIYFSGEIQALTTVSYKIIVSTVEDIQELYISITPVGFEKFQISATPSHANIAFDDEHMTGWYLDTKAGVEYEFAGQVYIPKPPFTTGVYSFSLHTFLDFPGEGSMMHDVSIYIDGNGNEMNAAQVKSFEETGVYIVPEVTGFINFPSDTPYPTYPMTTATETITPIPTETPVPTLTETIIPYP